jgi:nucleoside-diphosphate-sugar epimerase
VQSWAIFGCGYVGRRLTEKLIERGDAVRAMVRNTARLEPLRQRGVDVRAFDAAKLRTFGPALFGLASPVVVYSIPPVPGMPAGESVHRASEAAGAVGATRFIYLSSTAVYGETPDGEWVDEDTPRSLSDPDAMPRVADEGAVETAALAGLPTVILRLTAIYGPGRGVRERLRAGTYQLIDGGSHVFSRVHVDDLVAIIVHAATAAPPRAVYCVSDDKPTPQLEYTEWLCKRLGVPLPPQVDSMAPGKRRRPVRNRAVSNQRLKEQLQYQFRYPSYVEGEMAIEKETGSGQTV